MRGCPASSAQARHTLSRSSPLASTPARIRSAPSARFLPTASEIPLPLTAWKRSRSVRSSPAAMAKREPRPVQVARRCERISFALDPLSQPADGRISRTFFPRRIRGPPSRVLKNPAVARRARPTRSGRPRSEQRKRTRCSTLSSTATRPPAAAKGSLAAVGAVFQHPAREEDSVRRHTGA